MRDEEPLDGLADSAVVECTWLHVEGQNRERWCKNTVVPKDGDITYAGWKYDHLGRPICGAHAVKARKRVGMDG